MAFSVSFDKHIADNKLVVTSRFNAPLKSVWKAFTDAQVLDKWWGPKPYKAVTEKMDFTEHGRWFYYMVSPQGEKTWSLFDFQKIEPLKYFDGLDAFADEKGNPKTDSPRLKWQNSFSEENGVTTVVNTLQGEGLKVIIDMGFEEGYRMGLTQLNELLQKN